MHNFCRFPVSGKLNIGKHFLIGDAGMAEQHKTRSMGSDVMTARRSTQEEIGLEQAGSYEVETVDIVELAFRLLGSWKLIMGLALCFAIVACVYTFLFVTPTYEATSIIYIVSNKDSAINMSDLQLGSELTQDYIKVFRMWEVHEEVISNLGLPYDYDQMREMLTVTNDSDTRMLDITIRSSDPQEAAEIANEYAEVTSEYIAETMSTEKPNIMSVALVPTNPVSPNMTLNVIIGFVLGAFLAVAVVTIRMLMDDKYKTAEDIRKYTGLVTLAAIPLEESDKTARRQPARDRRRP